MQNAPIYIIANDNQPLPRTQPISQMQGAHRSHLKPRSSVLSFKSAHSKNTHFKHTHFKHTQAQRQTPKDEKRDIAPLYQPQQTQNTQTTRKTTQQTIWQTIWLTLPAIITLGLLFLSKDSGATKMPFLSTSVLMGTGLFLALWTVLCQFKSAWRCAEFTVLISLITLSLGLIQAGPELGLIFTSVDIALACTLAGLGFSWIFRSRTALLFSLLASVAWLASLAPAFNLNHNALENLSQNLGFDFSQTPLVQQSWIHFVPLILFGQFYLAVKYRATAAICITTLLAYGWGAYGGWLASIPTLPLAGLGFAAGAAHYRLGKAWADTQKDDAKVHISLGAIAAALLALYIQQAWIDPNNMPNLGAWMPGTAWKVGLGVSALIVFCSSIMRYKQTKMSLPGIFILSLTYLALPIATVRSDIIIALFSTVPGLEAAPGFALVLGTALVAWGVIWSIAGVRSENTPLVIIGAALVLAQIFVLFNPQYITVDFGIIFGFGLAIILCLTLLTIGTSHEQPAPRPTA